MSGWEVESPQAGSEFNGRIESTVESNQVEYVEVMENMLWRGRDKMDKKLITREGGIFFFFFNEETFFNVKQNFYRGTWSDKRERKHKRKHNNKCLIKEIKGQKKECND